MKIHITDTFTKSLKVLIRHQTWWYKTYSVIRWDIWHFFKNIWRFRKELWDHKWWDYRFTLNMLERSLTIMEGGMSTKGMEVSETREPKVKSMRRALELLRNNREDKFVERAEAELGPITRWDWELDENGVMVDRDTPEQKEHNRNVFKRAREIEDKEWKELWEIFKGTKYSKSYRKNYDGTDMRAWWD
jgi:hypothetical protein